MKIKFSANTIISDDLRPLKELKFIIDLEELQDLSEKIGEDAVSKKLVDVATSSILKWIEIVKAPMADDSN